MKRYKFNKILFFSHMLAIAIERWIEKKCAINVEAYIIRKKSFQRCHRFSSHSHLKNHLNIFDCLTIFLLWILYFVVIAYNSFLLFRSYTRRFLQVIYEFVLTILVHLRFDGSMFMYLLLMYIYWHLYTAHTMHVIRQMIVFVHMTAQRKKMQLYIMPQHVHNLVSHIKV